MVTVMNQILIGADAIKKLSESRVAVFGIGGVGNMSARAFWSM